MAWAFSGIDVADLYANSRKQKKKTVDTKASKGRKLRYVFHRDRFLLITDHAVRSYKPHEKLQNFMVPVPVRGAWHEEQIDELFASLFGKGFEGDEPIPTTKGLKESGELQNFRLFG